VDERAIFGQFSWWKSPTRLKSLQWDRDHAGNLATSSLLRPSQLLLRLLVWHYKKLFFAAKKKIYIFLLLFCLVSETTTSTTTIDF
jgi:hypothetical protein